MKLFYAQPSSAGAVDAELQPLRPALLGPLPGATVEGLGNYIMPYGNARLNSRTATAASGALRESWRAAMAPGAKPRFVFQSGASVVVQAATWQLFDIAGKPLGQGSNGPAPMYLDGVGGHVFAIDPNGLLGAFSTQHARRQYFVMPDAGERAGYAFLDRHGNEVLLAASSFPEGNFEQLNPAAPPAPQPPVMSSLELLTWPSLPAVAHGGLRVDATSVKLDLPSDRLLAARNGEDIVLAARNALLFVDRRLAVKRAYALDGVPLAMSLDESGRVYLILERAGIRQLLKIGPGGELGFSVTLTAGQERPGAPPVIGYDHRVYLSQGGTILAFDTGGRQLWTARSAASVSGMVVTPNGVLLVSAGASLAAYDATGKRTSLFELTGETFTTPPIVTSDGLILVATDKSLLALSPR